MSEVEPQQNQTQSSSESRAPGVLPRIALAGNPNSGKTTLFNALTGLRYKVANYPGVTVERKEGQTTLAHNEKVSVVDLPGVYSLSGHSEDELISTSFLLGELPSETRPEVIIAVVDASNLERNLYLTSQLIDLGQPTVLALNMMDVAEEQGIAVRTELLATALGIPVVPICARSKQGLTELKQQVSLALKNRTPPGKQFTWLPVCSPYRTAAEELGTAEAAARGYPAGFAVLLLGARLLANETVPVAPQAIARLPILQQELKEKRVDPTSFEATARYQFVSWAIRRSVARSGAVAPGITAKIDALLTHRFWGMAFFLLVMATTFQGIFAWAGAPMEWIDWGVQQFSELLLVALPPGILRSLLIDGIVAGVGGVIIFIPQIAILFAILGVLEDSGYLARAAFIMDRAMRQVGLQGRSFIPLLSSFACAIPGIMSTRTIPSIADRMVTIMVAPLMSCSARLPVYTLLIAAFIPQQSFAGIFSLQGAVLLSLYLLGILGAAAVAWILKLTTFRGEPALFIMEMPPLRRPSLRTVARDVVDRILLFIRGAGTVILACSIVLWVLASFPEGPVEQSYAGQIGKWMEPAIAPLGWNWEVGVGILASFAAREVFISSLATVYNLESATDSATSVLTILEAKYAAGTFTLPAALSLLVFYVFACQCMSTLAICKRETGGWRWPLAMFAYMSALAYASALLTHYVAVSLGL